MNDLRHDAETVVTTILLTDLVDSTSLVERLGDARAAEVFTRQDRLARDLLVAAGGREIDKTDGFLILFDRPIDAVRFAMAYHDGLAELGEELSVPLAARAAVHLGELVIKENPVADVARGAKRVEVEGLAKPMAARVMNLAGGGQTLLTRAAFDLARRAAVGDDATRGSSTWMAHGPYLLKGCGDPVEIFEVGRTGVAPLRAPGDTGQARRSVAAGDEATLGWRPAAGLPVPRRPGWMLERKLGEGGFGEVWLATSRPTGEGRVFKFCFNADRLRSLQREVTLFRLLREVLGDRADIARLYEVQLDEAPYFLESEFTPSGSLEDWAAAEGGIEHIPPATRLDIVARTARAVAAAHSVGVLHKDIKPGNILIGLDADGRPRPRLADFGIGTLTDPRHLQGHGITAAGFTEDTLADLGSRTGTRLYSPPESMTGRPFTMRGDIYALGVLLYQMVVGELTRPLAQGWEGDVPDPLLREDIAACVAGDEMQRLDSATELAQRLESLPLRRRQRGRRRLTRMAVGLGAAAVLVLAAGAAWGFRERSLRNQAEREAERTQASLDWIVGALTTADAYDGETSEVKVRDVLAPAVTQLEVQFADEPEIRARLTMTIGRMYKQLAEYERARDLLTAALVINRRLDVPPGPLTAENLQELAATLWHLREFAAAEPLDREALAIQRELAAADRRDPLLQLAVADTCNHLAACLEGLGRPDEAEALFRESLAIRQSYLPAGHRDLSRSMHNFGTWLRNRGRYADATVFFREALAGFEALHDGPHLHVAGCRGALGKCLMRTGNMTEARSLLESAVTMKLEVLAPDHTSHAFALLDLGEWHMRAGAAGDAEPLLWEALRIRRRGYSPGDLRTAMTQSVLALCLDDLGRESEAEPLRRDAGPVIEDAAPRLNEDERQSLRWIAAEYERLGRQTDAARYRAFTSS